MVSRENNYVYENVGQSYNEEILSTKRIITFTKNIIYQVINQENIFSLISLICYMIQFIKTYISFEYICSE